LAQLAARIGAYIANAS